MVGGQWCGCTRSRFHFFSRPLCPARLLPSCRDAPTITHISGPRDIHMLVVLPIFLCARQEAPRYHALIAFLDKLGLRAAGKQGLEVGVWQGGFSRMQLQGGSHTLHLVDSWRHLPSWNKPLNSPTFPALGPWPMILFRLLMADRLPTPLIMAGASSSA